MRLLVLLFYVFNFLLLHYIVDCSGSDDLLKKPTVLISILARNKAHTLPYFLTLLERLSYPKERISLWIRSDHNIDKTIEIVQLWLRKMEREYHSVAFEYTENDEDYPDSKGIAHWSEERFNNIINLRESALNHARNKWAEYFLALDCDVFLTNPNSLQMLIAKNLTITAPMLKSDGLYSNFWHGMTDDYYYQRTDEYKQVLDYEKVGCFNVPMVHSCVLIDLRKTESDHLTYNHKKVKAYDGPIDDIITFALGANKSHVDLNVCNDVSYGYVMVPLEEETDNTLDFDKLQLTNLKLQALSRHDTLSYSDLFAPYVSMPTKDKMNFDEIYMINLLRRPERRRRMLQSFDELGLDVLILDAVDGKLLNDTFLDKIKFMPGYADPYHKRPMTLGEIGCFLSHYNIWKHIAENGHGTSLILEDDIRFEPFFRHKVNGVMDEVRRLGDWDLVYFGRKRLEDVDEPWIIGAKYLVEVGYSYWTLGYALSLSGAKKLLEANPLTSLVPVDEYLPILFDKHPKLDWKGHFPKRDLVAYSAAPLLLYPTHYTGEKGYISDTEDSITISKVIERDDL